MFFGGFDDPNGRFIGFSGHWAKLWHRLHTINLIFLRDLWYFFAAGELTRLGRAKVYARKLADIVLRMCIEITF